MGEDEKNSLPGVASVENEGRVNQPILTLHDKSTQNAAGKPVTRGEMNIVTGLIVGVIVVLFVALTTMILDSSADKQQTLREKEQSYQELRNSYHDQTKELYEVRLELQQTKNELLHSLEKKVDK